MEQEQYEIKIEDFDRFNDQILVKEAAIPYFRDLFNDLQLRNSS